MSKKFFTSAFTFTLILAVSIIFLGLYITGENIRQVNFYYEDDLIASSTKSDTSELSQDVKDILNIMKSKKPYKEEYLSSPKYSAQIISDKDNTTAFFDVDIDNDLVVITIDDSHYTLSEDDYLRLTCNPLFKEVYYRDAIQSSPLSLDGEALEASSSYKLTYNDESGKSMDVKGSHPVESSTIHLTGINNNIRFDGTENPSKVTLNVFQGDKIVYSSDVIDNNIPIITTEGELRYVVAAIWDDTSNKSYRGIVSYEFYINLDMEPSFSIVGGNTKTAGQFYVIKASYLNVDEVPFVETDLIKANSFFKSGEDYLMIIPLDYYKTKSTHIIKYFVEKEGTKTNIGADELFVINADFDKQYLTVDEKTTSSTRNDEAYAEYDKVFAPVRENSNSSAYFTEGFQRPCDGRISTEFGMMRYVNGSLTSYRHSGLDIAAKRGTIVKATNTGKVALSTKLILTGNTVVIDHGLGIFSVYFHMDSLAVKEGEMVTKGQTVGTVGSTGFSTGPHLHFTTSYYKTNINPDYLINMPKESLNDLIKK